jgi:hypothetical protein
MLWHNYRQSFIKFALTVRTGVRGHVLDSAGVPVAAVLRINGRDNGTFYSAPIDGDFYRILLARERNYTIIVRNKCVCAPPCVQATHALLGVAYGVFTLNSTHPLATINITFERALDGSVHTTLTSVVTDADTTVTSSPLTTRLRVSDRPPNVLMMTKSKANTLVATTELTPVTTLMTTDTTRTTATHTYPISCAVRPHMLSVYILSTLILMINYHL